MGVDANVDAEVGVGVGEAQLQGVGAVPVGSRWKGEYQAIAEVAAAAE
jgi:hypothetical protein